MADPTEFGQQFLDVTEAPRKSETNVDGVPIDQFLTEAGEAHTQGTQAEQFVAGDPFIAVDDGVPPRPNIDPVEDFSRPNLDQLETELRESRNTRFNKAHSDAIIVGEPEKTAARFEDSESGVAPTVESQLLKDLQDRAKAKELEGFDFITDPEFLAKDPAERMSILSHAIGFIDARDLSRREVLLFNSMAAGYAEAPFVAFQNVTRDVGALDIAEMREVMNAAGIQEMRDAVNEIAAAQGWDSIGHAIGEIFIQDFIPIWNVGTRMGLANALTKSLESTGLEQGFRILPGEARQDIREHLVSLPMSERVAAVQAMVDTVKELQKNTKAAPWLTKYNVLESWEAIFTEELLQDNIAKNGLDRFFGNLEVALEGLFSVMVIMKYGRTMATAHKAGGYFKARAAAKALHHDAHVSAFDRAMADLGASFDVDPLEIVEDALPRPARAVENREVLTETNKDILDANDRVRSEILLNSSRTAGRGLDVNEKQDVVRRLITDIDGADSAEVMPRMTTVGELPDGAGVRINAVLGKTIDRGWDTTDDLKNALVEIDPNLEKYTIYVQEGSTGKLKEVPVSPDELARWVVKGELPDAIKQLDQFEDPLLKQWIGAHGGDLTAVPDDVLVEMSASVKGRDFQLLESEAARRAGGKVEPDSSFFVQLTVDRPWHTADKRAFADQSVRHTGIAASVLAPNAKFSDRIYGSFLTAYMDEQKLIADFEKMYNPYYKLSNKDKKKVASIMEWSEDFGKNNGRAPKLSEIISDFDELTDKQIGGYISLRDGLDLQYELFNRRLFREGQALGWKTATPVNGDLPIYHGDLLDITTVPRGSAKYYDPVTQRLKQLSAEELDVLYRDGGGILKVDIAVQAANDSSQKADLVLIGPQYEMGKLSTRPLKYHPGYSMRFYEDPYFIIKTNSATHLNGKPALQALDTDEAIRTAGTQLEGEGVLSRMGTKDANGNFIDFDNPTVSYRLVRSRDITSTEGSLFQKQALQREGRLFWDERSFDRLPDVNGNRARLEDPVRSLEKSTAMAARQLTHEDLLKSMKGAWENTYSDLISPGAFANKSMDEILKDLSALRTNAVDKGQRTRIGEAMEFVKYFRLITGTESRVIPAMRRAVINVAAAVHRLTGVDGFVPNGFYRNVDRFAQTLDPSRTMRSIAFHAFMVFRPFRQALLQGAQVSFLLGMAPKYIGTGAVFKDAAMLRRGVAKLHVSGYDDGFSVGVAAKAMGLSKKEYRQLVKEFDRSGLIELVDVHSFAGGTRSYNKTAIPESPLGAVGQGVKKGQKALSGFFQTIGFNFGERNNLTFTYLVALKRHLKANKMDSLLDMKQADWDRLRIDASNLALGMVKPNNFGYQSGFIGVATQFLSFQHKAGLALLGKNPAINSKDALKVLAGTYLLFGANMFGARDIVEQSLNQIGVPQLIDEEIPGFDGATMVDVLSAGVVEKGVNEIVKLWQPDSKDLDLSFLAPGVDVSRFYEMQLEGIIKSPGEVAFGPFGNIASSTFRAYNFATDYINGTPDASPVDKFTVAADALMSGMFPLYNDLVFSYLGYQFGIWYSTSGEALPLRPTMNALLARGVFGARTQEEMSYYRLQNERWESDEFYNEVVKENKRHLTRLINRWNAGEYTTEQVLANVAMLGNLMESFPEGRRVEVYEASMLDSVDGGPSVQKQLVDSIAAKKLTKEQAEFFINQFPDIDPEAKQQLQWLIDDVYDETEQTEQTVQSILLGEE